MNPHSSVPAGSGPPLDIRAVLTIRAWCDDKFATDFRNDPIGVTRALLREHGLDEARAADYAGALPDTPIGDAASKPTLHAYSTYNADSCPTNIESCATDYNRCATGPEACSTWWEYCSPNTEVYCEETFATQCSPTLGMPCQTTVFECPSQNC